MSESPNQISFEQMAELLIEKRNIYNTMLNEDREFEQVKSLFIEIRELEKSIQGWQDEISKQ